MGFGFLSWVDLEQVRLLCPRTGKGILNLRQIWLEITRVVVGKDGDESAITKIEQVQEDEYVMINSGFLDGMDIHKATEKMMDHIESKGYGKRK